MNKKKIYELINYINEGKRILNNPFTEIGKYNTPKILNIPKPNKKKIIVLQIQNIIQI